MITESTATRTPSLKGINMSPQFIEKFESLIDRNGPTQSHTPELGPCWIWMGSRFQRSRTNKPYGRIFLNPYTVKAHRVSYAIYIGDVPDDLLCRHLCDCEFCVNPSHLALGTYQDNSNDMTSHGRQCKGDDQWQRKFPEMRKLGDEHWTRRNPELVKRGDSHPWRNNRELAATVMGEGNPSAVLTSEKVLSIRSEFSIGGITRMELAIKYGMGWSQIDRIVKRKSWTNI